MLLTDGNYSSGNYRFGFNGQEKDDEIYGTGNSLNFKYRMHDPRIGRFFAVDPLAKKYPYNSPYAFSENRVIDGVELEGLEFDPVTQYLYLEAVKGIVKWGRKMRRASDNLVEAATNVGEYNNPHVPENVQRQVRLNQAGEACQDLNEGIEQAAVASLEAFSMIPGVETMGDAVLTTYALIEGNDEDAMAYAAGLLLPGVSGSAVKKTKGLWKKLGPIHHIFTNKNFKRGQQWSKKFMPLFEKAGYKLDDAINKVRIRGHKGPHPQEYHNAVYERLKMATEGLEGDGYKEAFDKTLNKLRKEASTEGTELNKLLTKKE